MAMNIQRSEQYLAKLRPSSFTCGFHKTAVPVIVLLH